MPVALLLPQPYPRRALAAWQRARGPVLRGQALAARQQRRSIGRHTVKVQPISLQYALSGAEEGGRAHSFLSMVAAPRTPHQEQIAFAEKREAVFAELDKVLSTEQSVVMRAALTMYPLGYSTTEIANHIGKTPGTILSQLSLSRKRIATERPDLKEKITDLMLSDMGNEGAVKKVIRRG